MTRHQIIVPLEEILQFNEGRQETFSFADHITFSEPALKADSEITMKLTFLKMEEGIHVTFENVQAKGTAKCSRCLQDFDYDIEVPSADRVFFFRTEDADSGDPNDIYLVDTRNQEIDTFEVLRQEILLHFPQTPVCSTGCKGICQNCGKELNKGKCSCTNDTEKNEIHLNKPLSKLKDLFNTDNN